MQKPGKLGQQSILWGLVRCPAWDYELRPRTGAVGEPLPRHRDVGEQTPVHGPDPHPPLLLCGGRDLFPAALRKCFPFCSPLNPFPIMSNIPVGEESDGIITLISYSTTNLPLLKQVHAPKRGSYIVP